jgi:hypothetical protein
MKIYKIVLIFLGYLVVIILGIYSIEYENSQAALLFHSICLINTLYLIFQCFKRK